MTFSIRYLILCFITCALLLKPSTTHDLMHVTPQLTQREQHKIIQQFYCIKEALIHEAIGEGNVGLTAVLSVIYNRTQHKNYPSTYCGVIQQKFQFSYRNHLRKGQMMPVKRTYNAKEQQIVLQVQDMAFKAAIGSFDSILEDGVTMYHAVSMKKYPSWSKKFKKYATIGHHIFYKG